MSFSAMDGALLAAANGWWWDPELARLNRATGCDEIPARTWRGRV
ncbi:MAG TPA: hypothetical protein VIG31_01435 [Rhodanobacteraceae bacterium]